MSKINKIHDKSKLNILNKQIFNISLWNNTVIIKSINQINKKVKTSYSNDAVWNKYIPN